MKLSAGRKAPAVLVAIVALGAAASRIDVPRLLGPIKGDEASYVSMALSVAYDHDLKYKAEDYTRFVEAYRQGPEGIFLKRSHKGPADQELDYGKPFAYSVAAAPFVRLFGLGGLLLFNVLLLAICIWCAVLFGRARAGGTTGALLGVTFVCASIVPIYVGWLTSELFNFTLIVAAYFLWLYKEVKHSSQQDWVRSGATDAIGAVLIGIATFSKPLYAPLIAPIVATALLRRRWQHGIVIAGVFAITVGALFASNTLVSGEWNYQGGDRNSFLSHFPFDPEGTRFEAGKQMATNEANDENILAPRYVAGTLPKNVFYFLFGRDAGLFPYYFPGALILLLWLPRVGRSRDWQLMTAGAWFLAVLGLLLLAPAIWNGGGGPIGNRYFLGLYPPLLFLLPTSGGVIATALSWAVSVVWIGFVFVHPFTYKQQPWLVPERAPLRFLPIEMTILNQLPVALNRDRWRVKVSDDPLVFLYYMDSHTYFQEPGGGFWVAPGTTEIVVRTERPLTGLKLRLKSPVNNTVDISIDGRSAHQSISKGGEVMVSLRPKPGLYALASYQIVLRITTANGFYPRDFDPVSKDTRHLGVFIRPTYEVD